VSASSASSTSASTSPSSSANVSPSPVRNSPFHTSSSAVSPSSSTSTSPLTSPSGSRIGSQISASSAAKSLQNRRRLANRSAECSDNPLSSSGGSAIERSPSSDSTTALVRRFSEAIPRTQSAEQMEPVKRSAVGVAPSLEDRASSIESVMRGSKGAPPGLGKSVESAAAAGAKNSPQQSRLEKQVSRKSFSPRAMLFRQRSSTSTGLQRPKDRRGSRSNLALDMQQEPEEQLEDIKTRKQGLCKFLRTFKGERNNIAAEVFTTELSYVDSLNKLVLVIKRPSSAVAEKAPWTEEEVSQIFGNVEEVRRLNTELLSNIEARFKHWNDERCIADVFLEHLDRLKEVYLPYCTGQEDASKKYESIMERSQVTKFQQRVLPLCDGITIPAYLIMPVQRVPRYVLLFRDLLKRTDPAHPDFESLTTLVQKVKEVADLINEGIRAEEKQKAFADVTKNISGMADLSQSRFIGEASFKLKVQSLTGDAALDREVCSQWGSKSRVVLFTNVLVFGKPASDTDKKKNVKKTKKPTPQLGSVEKRFFLHQLWVDDVPDSRTKFVIRAPELRFTLEAHSALDKTTHMKRISEAVTAWCRSRKGMLMPSHRDPSVEVRVFSIGLADGRRYKGEWVEAEPTGYGRIDYVDGSSYQGVHKKLVRDGRGLMTYIPHKVVYEGEWSNNLPHGFGKLIMAGHGRYEGQWSMGSFHGTGLMVWGAVEVLETESSATASGVSASDDESSPPTTDSKDERERLREMVKSGAAGVDRYDGEWVAGLRHGTGKMEHANGDVYVGEWQRDRKHGKGKWISANSVDFYDGQWREDRREGNGEAAFGTKETYIGSWVDNLPEGRGKRVYADKSVYEGEFVAGLREGTGKETLANGDQYEGSYKRDSYAGEGVLRFADGSVYEGCFASGAYEGEGKMTASSGIVYHGGWHHGLYFGKGILILPSGEHYEGSFLKGRRNGDGEARYPNGDLYIGQWRGGLRHGHGSFTEKATGLSYEGEWENDQPHGEGQLRDVMGLYSGQFFRGLRHGEGMLLNEDGIALRGRWVHGRRDGEFTKQPLTASADHVPTIVEFTEDRLKVEEQVVYQPFIPHRPHNFG